MFSSTIRWFFLEVLKLLCFFISIQDSGPLVSPTPRGNSKLKILLVQLVYNKKQVKYFQLPQKRSNFVTSRKQPHISSNHTKKNTRSSRQRITMGRYKTKATEADLDIFTHISSYSDILCISRHIQA